MRLMTVRGGLIATLLAMFALFSSSGLRASEEGKEQHPKRKYKTTIHGPKGEEDKTFDLSNPKDEEELKQHFAEGRVVELVEDKPPSFLELKWDLGLWSVVVFLGLLYILNKVAWKPMLDGLKNREENIRKALEDAEAARRDAAEMRTRFESEIRKAQDEAREVVAQARRDANRAGEELLAKAKAEINLEKERAQRELETAKDQAVKELLDYTANLAAAVATKAVRRQLNQDDYRRLVDESLNEMAATLS